MKRIFTLVAAATLAFGATAQQPNMPQLLNGGFEDWQNVSGGSEPNHWNSFLTASGSFTSFGANQISVQNGGRPGSTGSKFLKMWSRSVLSLNANGNITTGRINMGSTSAANEANHAYTDRSNPDFHQTMTARPDSIVFWAKYNPTGGNANSRARIAATIHGDVNFIDPERSNQNSFVVGKAIHNFNKTNDQWVRFSVPFDYSFPSNDPLYILITLTTCETPGGCGSSDELFIDDIELIYSYITANNDVYTINQGDNVNISNPTTGVLANDVAFNTTIDPTTIEIIQAPANGAINTLAGSLIYLPRQGFYGTETFRYRVSDVDGRHTSEAVVTVNVNYVPVAENTDVAILDDAAIVYPGVVAHIDVLANDFVAADYEFNMSSFEIVRAPQIGTATINESNMIVYQSNGTSSGSDSLQYRICDNQTTPSCGTAYLRIQLDFSSVENTVFSDLVLFTNNDRLFFKGSNLEGANYSIYTTSGSLVASGAVDTSVEFNVSTGVYLVEITAANGETRKRIIKQ